jgi:hypothetical protein
MGALGIVTSAESDDARAFVQWGAAGMFVVGVAAAYLGAVSMWPAVADDGSLLRVRSALAVAFAAVFMTPAPAWVVALRTERRVAFVVAALAHVVLAAWVWTIVSG